MYESELIPLFEKCGTIWDLRLMMDPMTGLNRGYAFVTFTNRDAAQEAVRQVTLKKCMIYTLWQNSIFCWKKKNLLKILIFWQKLSYFHSVFYYSICYTNDRKASDLYNNQNGEWPFFLSYKNFCSLIRMRSQKEKPLK